MRRLPQSIAKRWKLFRQAMAGIEDGALDEPFLLSLMSGPSPLILDIGCNDGHETRMFLRLFPQARVFSFEPDARARKRFCEQTADPRANLIPCALGSVNGTAMFFPSTGSEPGRKDPSLPKDWDCSGSIHAPRAHLQENPDVHFGAPEEIPIRTLDAWAGENSVTRVDFIWADVQGAEVDLITGGRATLRHTHYLYTEYSDRELYAGQVNFRQLCCLLPDFRVRRRFRHDVLFENMAWRH